MVANFTYLLLQNETQTCRWFFKQESPILFPTMIAVTPSAPSLFDIVAEESSKYCDKNVILKLIVK